MNQLSQKNIIVIVVSLTIIYAVIYKTRQNNQIPNSEILITSSKGNAQKRVDDQKLSKPDRKEQREELAAGEVKEENERNEMFDYGETTPLASDANEDVKEVYRSITSRTPDPHRVSAFFTQGFDLKEYKKDRAGYLKNIQPGTVFNSLTPGKGIPQIKRVSSFKKRVRQGEYVDLEIKIEGGKGQEMVTFTSFDLGHFENGLTSINKMADRKGHAKAKFYGAPGTINSVKILAASPMASGRVDFSVFVTLADGTLPGEPKAKK